MSEGALRTDGRLTAGFRRAESARPLRQWRLPTAHEIPEQIAALRGFRALHAGMRLAGLRYSGKGANRTILDCMFRPVQAEQAVVSAAAGVAGAGSLSRPFAIQALSGGGFRLQMRKGLVS
jgi:hypothetical protein